MIRYNYIKFFLLLSLFATAMGMSAQWTSHKSVLAEQDWYKIGVTEEGVYGIDYATLQAMGVDPRQIDPSKIRLFGNVQGPLPEANAAERYDDLTEVAIVVTGDTDGSFDEDDRIVFYGQGPVNMVRATGDYFTYERNPYTDTVYYFLCVGGDVTGLRIEDHPSVATSGSDPIVNVFPDYYYYESDELSPYASGRAWYGDLFTAQEGYKEFTIEVPNLIPERGVRVESNVLGRCKPAASYNLKLNDLYVVAHQTIDAYKDRNYGRVHRAVKTMYQGSEPLTLRYDLDPSEGNPMIFIDYFVLSFWRSLQYQGDDMRFAVFPSQLPSDVAMVKVEGTNPSTVCWDVTDPIHPFRQLTGFQDGDLTFGLEGHDEHRYRLFEMSAVQPVASFRRIRNQDLHGLESAEFLIITPRVFWDQATELADFHAENDGMECVVADVEEVYNEFGTGTGDPTALRDFIRMLYLRSEGGLKYVLLFGKGTHDYRGIKQVDNNFVPTYETAGQEFAEVNSMCSDDYFALMDEEEGDKCSGKVDLGVGRLPIVTPEQGRAMVAKIKHYADPDNNHGLWKNNHLLMADNDSWYYPNYAEGLSKILDTANADVTQKKLYMDSYPVVTTSSATRCPLANKALMEYFDKGINVMSYTGHGGVKSLSEEWVLALSDIQSMSNADKLPFVHTATCEFSKFDDPGVTSGGEMMILHPNGGAIAMLTTVRPTVAENNQKLSRSFCEHIYDKEHRESLRFGDIYKLVKSDPRHYSMTNIVYVLFADPALRFAYPSRSVVTEQVQSDEMLRVSGYVTDLSDSLDAQFNGVLDFRLYDQKSKITSLGLYDRPITYAYFKDVLFEGKVSVVDGRFEARVPLPSLVSQGDGRARLVYSAYDSIRKVEAAGAYDGLEVQAPTTVIDHQGPEIKLYWNTPDFQTGDVVAPNGVLYADLFDEHGIYHYNVSIGRDIVLSSNAAGFENVVLTDAYEPAVDDYQRGRVTLPVGELPDGEYEFTLKAWDTWNNSSEVAIVVVIERDVLLAEVRNYPNPFTDEVYFSFVDGQQTEHLEVLVEVFDVMGRCVARVQQSTEAVAGVVAPIRWDGKHHTGGELGPGLYLYRLSITDSAGKTRVISHQMVKK